MNNSYLDLVQQTFNFPQEGLEVKNGYLQFNGLDIKALIDKYGTPMKLTYLPKIGMQINKAKDMFAKAIKKHKYEGEYFYCYCTKSSHFSFIVEEALQHNIHLETSYAYDIEIIKKLYEKNVKNLSGGELQKVAVVASLIRQADIYALDEPSAFMDVEDRIALAKFLQHLVRSQGKSAVIIEHDLQIIDLAADSLITFEGNPGIEGFASIPMNKKRWNE